MWYIYTMDYYYSATKKKRWDIVEFKPKLCRGQLYIFRDSTLKDVRIWGKMTGTGRKRQDETLALGEQDGKKGGRGPRASDTSRCLERQSEGTREEVPTLCPGL